MDNKNQKTSTALVGMKEITNYLGICEATARKWVSEYGLPATKLGGSWVSDRLKIDDWMKGKI